MYMPAKPAPTTTASKATRLPAHVEGLVLAAGIVVFPGECASSREQAPLLPAAPSFARDHAGLEQRKARWRSIASGIDPVPAVTRA